MTGRRAAALERPIEADPLAAGIAAADLDLLRRLPKAELHLHLDGSLRPSTALELARQRGVDAGLDLERMTDALVAPERCLDQADLLRAFDLPIAILQDAEALERVTLELVEDAASDGTRYVEIRWGPGLHLQRGLSLRDGIAAVARGAERGATAVVATGAAASSCGSSRSRCAPTTQPSTSRSHGPPRDAMASGLVGFDLAGPEAAYPDPLLHADAFAVARAAGLGITVHAGEWGGAAQVRRALGGESGAHRAWCAGGRRPQPDG